VTGKYIQLLPQERKVVFCSEFCKNFYLLQYVLPASKSTHQKKHFLAATEKGGRRGMDGEGERGHLTLIIKQFLVFMK
jgi:hypothetical protein